MIENNFIWADLSTFDLSVAKSFYSTVLKWHYKESSELYHTAHYKEAAVSGLYETPEKFREMNMPSFWMSYIQVASIDKTVAKAKKLGGIVELVDHEEAIGPIALIRDPSGAGFIVYEGGKLNARTLNKNNTLVWNELFVSKAGLVIDFYQKLFHWEIEAGKNGRYLIYDSKKILISAIQEVSNEIKGKHEYWGVFFAFEDLEKAKKLIKENKGHVVYEDKKEDFLLATDPLGAIFHLKKIPKTVDKSATIQKSYPWKSAIFLSLAILSIAMNWTWFWGLLFLVWILPDLKYGETHLIEPLSRFKNPFLYWVTMITWLSLSLYLIYEPLKANFS